MSKAPRGWTRRRFELGNRIGDRYSRDAVSPKVQRRAYARLGHGRAKAPWLQLSRPGCEAQEIANRVAELTEDQLIERYHELVDQRLANSMGVAGSFELDRIEARLNVLDQGEVDRVTAFRDQWNEERGAVLASIEAIVAKLRAAY